MRQVRLATSSKRHKQQKTRLSSLERSLDSMASLALRIATGIKFEQKTPACSFRTSLKLDRSKLVNLGKRTTDLLVMTKLIMVFNVYDSEKEALASFS